MRRITTAELAEAIAEWIDGEFDDGRMLQYGAHVLENGAQSVIRVKVFDAVAGGDEDYKHFDLVVSEG